MFRDLELKKTFARMESARVNLVIFSEHFTETEKDGLETSGEAKKRLPLRLRLQLRPPLQFRLLLSLLFQSLLLAFCSCSFIFMPCLLFMYSRLVCHDAAVDVLLLILLSACIFS